MCLTQNELFPLHNMMSHLPIEFSLLPPTCKRNLIGCYSNLSSDKVAEREEKKQKTPISSEDLIQYFSSTVLYLCRSIISVCSYPSNSHSSLWISNFYLGPSKSSQLFYFTSQTTFQVSGMWSSRLHMLSWEATSPLWIQSFILPETRVAYNKDLASTSQATCYLLRQPANSSIASQSCCSPAHCAICTAGIQR